MRLAVLLVMAGCGRLSFDPLATASSDGSTDGVVVSDALQPLNCAGRIICDGFEGPAFANNWNLANINGVVNIDNGHVHRGNFAFRVHTNAGISGDQRKAELSDSTSLPTTNVPRILYARSWGYFQSPLPNAYNQFITFANGSGNGFALGDRNLNMTTNHFFSVDFAESATKTLPLDRWVCLQIEFPTNQTGTVRGFVDGAEVADLALPVSPAEATMTQVFIGLDWPMLNQTIPAIDAWFDDVIIDVAPISCDD